MRLLAVAFFATFLCISNVEAQAWRSSIIKKLPPSLAQITIGKTTQKEVEKILGPAALIEKSKQYWAYDKFKYSLQITYKDKKVSSLHFTFTKNQPEMRDIKPSISSKELSLNGHFLKHSHPKGDLLFDSLTKKVYSVELR